MRVNPCQLSSSLLGSASGMSHSLWEYKSVKSLSLGTTRSSSSLDVCLLFVRWWTSYMRRLYMLRPLSPLQKPKPYDANSHPNAWRELRHAWFFDTDMFRWGKEPPHVSQSSCSLAFPPWLCVLFGVNSAPQECKKRIGLWSIQPFHHSRPSNLEEEDAVGTPNDLATCKSIHIWPFGTMVWGH